MKPGVLHSMGSQRVRHDLLSEQQEEVFLCCLGINWRQNWSLGRLGMFDSKKDFVYKVEKSI